jgi:hypothetical protein
MRSNVTHLFRPKPGCVDPKKGLPSTVVTESIYDYVMSQLEAAKGSWPDVAAGSGVSRRTIEKIARREIKDPGVSSVEKLARYFREVSRQH